MNLQKVIQTLPRKFLFAGTLTGLPGGGPWVGAEAKLERKAGPGELRGCNSITGLWRDHKLTSQVSRLTPFLSWVIYKPIILRRDCFLFHIIQIFS